MRRRLRARHPLGLPCRHGSGAALAPPAAALCRGRAACAARPLPAPLQRGPCSLCSGLIPGGRPTCAGGHQQGRQRQAHPAQDLQPQRAVGGLGRCRCRCRCRCRAASLDSAGAAAAAAAAAAQGRGGGGRGQGAGCRVQGAGASGARAQERCWATAAPRPRRPARGRPRGHRRGARLTWGGPARPAPRGRAHGRLPPAVQQLTAPALPPRPARCAGP
jgi:hypothetical protein